jgi:two-component system, NarL family, response regulator
MPTIQKASASRRTMSHWSARMQTSQTGPKSQQSPSTQDLPSAWNARNQPHSGLNNENPLVASSARNRADLLTVLVADDHPVVREGLVSLISHRSNMRVVAQARNGSEAVQQFFDHRPDVALIDLRMPVEDGLTALISICQKEPFARIAIISSYQLEEDIYRALRAGALGYILKDATEEQLVDCLYSVAEGKTWVPPQIGAKLARRVADQELTRRESQVLSAVAAGKSNKEIGAAFNISEATVKVHMTHLLEKLKVTGRTEAINVAVKRGLVHLDLAVAA